MQRLMPPGGGDPATITVNGRFYSCAIGQEITVPDQDAYLMMANGWVASASGAGGAGITASRPTGSVDGAEYFDSTLNKTIVFDGTFWIDPDTGAVV